MSNNNYVQLSEGPPLHRSPTQLAEKYEHQKIQFTEELENYRNRTQGERKFTVQQIEDVMFIDDKRLAAIEYVFYNQTKEGEDKISNYQYAKPHLQGEVDTENHFLGAENYMNLIKAETEQTNAFVDKPIIFDTVPLDEKCYLRKKTNSHMQKQSKGSDIIYQVEAVISLWNISKSGNLMKYKEQEFTYPITHQDSKMDHMRLALSDDKKYISLSCSDVCDHSSPTHFLAWNSNSLKPLKLNQRLLKNLNANVEGSSIKKIQFIGNSFYVIKEFVFNDPKQKIGILKNKFVTWQIFDVNSGKKVFERNNKFTASPNQDPGNMNDPDLRFISLLPRSKNFEKDEDEQKSDWMERCVNQIPTINKDDEDDLKDDINLDEEIDPQEISEQKTLDLVFFFVKDVIVKAELKNKVKLKRKDNKIDKKAQKSVDSKDTKGVDNWIWTYQTVDIVDLVSESKNQEIQPKQYVDKLIEEKYKEKGLKINQKQFFNISKNWFVTTYKNQKDGTEQDKDIKWEDNILISANNDFSKFGFLNQTRGRKLFLAFENEIVSKNSNGDDKWDDNAFTTLPISENAIVTFARNQSLKENLFLVYRVTNDTITYMFRPKQDKKVIVFKDDYEFSWQDTQVINGNSSDMCQLQSCSISAGDQEILLQTQVIRTDIDDEEKEEIVFRKSISQYHSIVFPVLCYNVGLNKIIAHNTLQGGKQYIIDLQPGQTFVNFVDFSSLESIGFYPDGLRIEACSRFAFLTLEQNNGSVYHLNFLLIDPYYQNPQIVLFKSTKVFDDIDTLDSVNNNQGVSRNLDTIIKMIVYNTKQDAGDNQFDVKLIIQFPDHFAIKQMVIPEELDGIGDEASQSDYSGSESEYGSEQSEDQKEKEASKCSQLPMILDEQGHIYFLTINDGQCTVKEINPAQDASHTIIYTMQSEYCHGLSYDRGYFYLMDSTKKVNQLIRQNESIELVENDVFTIKEKDWNNFKDQTITNGIMIMNAKYLIQGSRIFYLNNDIPFASGVLDMEELKESEWSYALGPFLAKGTNEFTIVYRNIKSKDFKQIIYQLPDSLTTKLIGDYENKVDMSTFLNDGDILLKVDYRFMRFGNDGQFKDEIEFSDVAKENTVRSKIKNQIRKAQQLNKKDTSINNDQQDENENEDDKDDDYDDKIDESKQVKIKTLSNNLVEPHKRMELIQMSQNNSYFLFYDNLRKQLKVYVMNQQDDGEYVFTMDANHNGKHGYEFDNNGEAVKALFEKVKKCVLDESGKKTYQSISSVDELKKLLDDQVINFSIENNGDVRMTYNDHDRDNVKDVKIKVYAGEFKNPKELGEKSVYRDFNTDVDFDEKSKVHAVRQLKRVKKELEYQVQVEEQQQNILAPVLRNKKKLNSLNNNISVIKAKMQNTVKSMIYDDDLLVVQCGRHIKYNWLTEDIWTKDSDLKDEIAKIEFAEDVIIEKIWTTCKKYNLQIVARDNKKQILIILTWDFLNNIEYSMLQFNIQADSRPENYVVRGLKQKLNYFVNMHQIYDLEYNIPMQASSFNSMQGNGVGSKYPNQRKIYEDSTISLSIDHGSVLNNPVCRIDLVFWKNITDLGEKVEDISENTSLEQFNTIYGGISLIHHFADKVDIIQMIHDKFLNAKDDKLLTSEQENMPLVILYPQNPREGEKDGETALGVALQLVRPSSFELMVDMLEDFNNFCLSKMMLGSFPSMIQMNTSVIQKFFASGVYKPPLMHFQYSIRWPEDTNQVVFPFYTSLLSKELLEEQLEKMQKIKPKHTERQKERQEKTIAKALAKFEKEKNKRKLNQQEKEEQKFTWVRKQILPREEQGDTETQRVDIEAIDFDWIFVGDEDEKNNGQNPTSNAKNLLILLNKQEDGELFVQKSIKIFIELVWEKYQFAIFQKVFILYIAYLISFIFLASSVAGNYLKEIEDGRNANPDRRFYGWPNGLMCEVVTILCFYFLYKFSFQMEIKQFIKEPQGYLLDPWNWADLFSFLFNFFFLIFLNINVGLGQNVIPIHAVRVVGAISCFLMWIKIFYWMRLFKNTAYFINLIIATFKDSSSFACMLLIIICAFTNLFFIIQLNVNDIKNADYHYVVNYTNENLTSALVAMYVLALGDFHFSGYGQGPDAYIAWAFFILGAYLMLLVFMNVLIAIMGDTFGRVSGLQEQSALKEQVSMMNDFIDYVNIAKEFKNQRYIIRVSPIQGEEETSTDVHELFEEHGKTLSKKAEQQYELLLRRMETFEKNTKQLLKSNQSKITQIKQEMIDALEKVKKNEDEDRESRNDSANAGDDDKDQNDYD